MSWWSRGRPRYHKFGGADADLYRHYRHGQLRPDPATSSWGREIEIEILLDSVFKTDGSYDTAKLAVAPRARRRPAVAGNYGGGLGTVANLLGVGNLTLDQILANPFDSIWGG